MDLDDLSRPKTGIIPPAFGTDLDEIIERFDGGVRSLGEAVSGGDVSADWGLAVGGFRTGRHFDRDHFRRHRRRSSRVEKG